MPTTSEPHRARAAARFTSSLRALRRVVPGDPPARPPARDLQERLAYIERDIEEMRTRINALFFTVLTATLGQLLARWFA